MSQYRLLTISLLSISCLLSAANAKKPWTIIIYMAADNSLQPDADINIEELKKIGSNDTVNILVNLHTKRPKQAKISQKLYVNSGSVTQLGPTLSLDSGSEKTFTDALMWAFTEYPADHYMVDIWDHGSGCLNRKPGCYRGCCYDDSTGSYLTDVNLKNAFTYAQAHALDGAKFDIVGFDACLMAGLEMAGTLQPFAHLQVSSQETIPGLGFDYQNTAHLFELINPTPLELATKILKSYKVLYDAQQQDYTLSIINLDTVNSLNDAHLAFSTILNNVLENYGQSVANAITSATSTANIVHFEEPTYIDLTQFYKNIINQAPTMGLDSSDQAELIKAARNALKARNSCITAHVGSSKYTNTGGISIYFPQNSVEPSYLNLVWAENNNPWVAFVQNYINLAS